MLSLALALYWISAVAFIRVAILVSNQLLCYVMLCVIRNVIEEEVDSNIYMFTGKILLGSRVCNGDCIQCRPCNGDDGD